MVVSVPCTGTRTGLGNEIINYNGHTEMETDMEREITDGDACNELPGTLKVKRSAPGEHGAGAGMTRESGSGQHICPYSRKVLAVGVRLREEQNDDSA